MQVFCSLSLKKSIVKTCIDAYATILYNLNDCSFLIVEM